MHSSRRPREKQPHWLTRSRTSGQLPAPVLHRPKLLPAPHASIRTEAPKEVGLPACLARVHIRESTEHCLKHASNP
jgi:hypothetical protein